MVFDLCFLWECVFEFVGQYFDVGSDVGFVGL